jgi:hypothetical protein
MLLRKQPRCSLRLWRDTIAVLLLSVGVGVHAADAASGESPNGDVAAASAYVSAAESTQQKIKTSDQRPSVAVEAWCLCAVTVEEAIFLSQYNFEVKAR